MKNLLCLTLLLAFAVVSLTAPVLAQETSPAPPAADTAGSKPAEEAEAPASQAVEINEDTYRQFMELKDANRQGDIIPETVYKPGSGLQKLDKLPEESQKHLRNELREIILQGEPWQPGDEDKDFPYVPSDAAVKDPALQKQEMEAWGELVDGYNQREAEIYGNATGSRATRSSEEGNGENPGEGSNSAGGTGQDSQGTEAQQAGRQASQDGGPDRADTAGTFSADAVNDPNARNSTGVSQNAMEFLQNRGQGGSSAGGKSTGVPTASGSQPGSPSPAGDQGQSQAQTQTGTQTQTGQQGETGQEDGTASPASASPTPALSTSALSTSASPTPASSTSAASPEASVAGTSQNALEFLRGAGAQAGKQEASGAGSAAADASQGGNSPGTPSQAQADAQQTGQQAGQQAGQNDGQASAQASAQGEAQTNAQASAQTDAKTEAQADAQANGADTPESGEQGQGQAQASAGGEGQAFDGQQSETAQKPVSIPPLPDSETPVTNAEPEEESTEGSSQNALEYLTGESAATGETADTSPPPAGTLNIQDLLNAQGLGGTPGTAAGTLGPGEEKPSDETKKDKDGDGQ